MSYIDKTGQGNTLLILTDAESRMIRNALTSLQQQEGWGDPLMCFNAGIARGTAQMAEESKADWKARKT